jgi:hypothetical protein
VVVVVADAEQVVGLIGVEWEELEPQLYQEILQL